MALMAHSLEELVFVWLAYSPMFFLNLGKIYIEKRILFWSKKYPLKLAKLLMLSFRLYFSFIPFKFIESVFSVNQELGR